MAYLREESDGPLRFEDSDGADDSDGGVGQFRLANIKDRPPIFDVDALHEALEDIAWETSLDWVQTQVLTMPTTCAVRDVNDDMARELAFYNQAKEGAEVAITRFEAAGTAWLRPRDYYAENVKSDGHMAKVKEQLMYEQRLIEEAEQRRKNREAKQYAKQVQAEKQKARVKEKKGQIESMTRLRKQRAQANFEGELTFDNDMRASQRLMPDKAGQRIRTEGTKLSKGRQARDAKFGFGGRKKLRKQNSAESSADMRSMGLASRGGRSGGRGGSRGSGAGRGRAGVQKRPGKRARDAKRRN